MYYSIVNYLKGIFKDENLLKSLMYYLLFISGFFHQYYIRNHHCWNNTLQKSHHNTKKKASQSIITALYSQILSTRHIIMACALKCNRYKFRYNFADRSLSQRDAKETKPTYINISLFKILYRTRTRTERFQATYTFMG